MENYIYFIEQEGTKLIKIGVAKDIKKRFSTLQTGSPQQLILRGYIVGGYDKEKELHNYFNSLHFGGEWFTLSDEIEKYITKNCIMDLNENIVGRNNINNEIKLLPYEGGDFNIVYRNKIEGVNNMKLNNNEKLVFYVLRDFAQYPTNCIVIKDSIPAMKDLEPIIGLNEKTIRRSLKSLEEKTLVKLVQYGHRKSIYINPEYYATGKDLDIKTLQLFDLIDCDDEKINDYIKNNGYK